MEPEVKTGFILRLCVRYCLLVYQVLFYTLSLKVPTPHTTPTYNHPQLLTLHPTSACTAFPSLGLSPPPVPVRLPPPTQNDGLNLVPGVLISDKGEQLYYWWQYLWISLVSISVWLLNCVMQVRRNHHIATAAGRMDTQYPTGHASLSTAFHVLTS